MDNPLLPEKSPYKLRRRLTEINASHDSGTTSDMIYSDELMFPTMPTGVVQSSPQVYEEIRVEELVGECVSRELGYPLPQEVSRGSGEGRAYALDNNVEGRSLIKNST